MRPWTPNTRVLSGVCVAVCTCFPCIAPASAVETAPAAVEPADIETGACTNQENATIAGMLMVKDEEDGVEATLRSLLNTRECWRSM